MKKISLKTIQSSLNEEELKNVLGGSGTSNTCSPSAFSCVGGTCPDYRDRCVKGATGNCGCYGLH